MNQKIFREFLATKCFDEEDIEKQIGFIKKLEENLHKTVPSCSLDDLNPSSIQVLVEELIDSGENTPEHFFMLLRYAKATGNQTMFATIFEMLDGAEAMENLHNKIAEVSGDELRDIIFDDLPLPPLGTSKREKARYTYRIIRRMEEIFEQPICREILSGCLRDLPDDYYTEHKTDFYEVCDADIDRFLVLKSQKFINTLRDHQQRGALFFGQEITDDVINFILQHPEMGGGVRDNDVIYETKIPYNTKAYLEETDPDLKRYHYCHCPWVKESLRGNSLKVSKIFCHCSAGFHKKPYEVIFDQPIQADVVETVLNGGEICRFAIHMPKGNQSS
jgi:hypothetical protein